VVKRAEITIILVEESEEKSNEELVKEIFNALSELPIKIPWMKKVEKVRVSG
jgi:predicted site-specific integrase-resolvase